MSDTPVTKKKDNQKLSGNEVYNQRKKKEKTVTGAYTTVWVCNEPTEQVLLSLAKREFKTLSQTPPLPSDSKTKQALIMWILWQNDITRAHQTSILQVSFSSLLAGRDDTHISLANGQLLPAIPAASFLKWFAGLDSQFSLSPHVNDNLRLAPVPLCQARGGRHGSVVVLSAASCCSLLCWILFWRAKLVVES